MEEWRSGGVEVVEEWRSGGVEEGDHKSNMTRGMFTLSRETQDSGKARTLGRAALNRILGLLSLYEALQDLGHIHYPGF